VRPEMIHDGRLRRPAGKSEAIMIDNISLLLFTFMPHTSDALLCFGGVESDPSFGEVEKVKQLRRMALKHI
jgi:hypothetical protein